MSNLPVSLIRRSASRLSLVCASVREGRMRVLALELCLVLLAHPAWAFITPVRYAQSRMTMRAESSDCEKRGFIEGPLRLSQKFVGYAAVVLATWQSSLSLNPSTYDLRVDTVQVAHAAQKRNDRNQAASQGSRVNKDAESLLRWGLPIDSKDARDLQEAIESVKDGIRSKRLSAAKSDAQKAKMLLSSKRDAILKKVRSGETAEASAQLKATDEKIDELLKVFDDDAGRGSEQERTKLDKLYALQIDAARALGKVEALMVPADYKVAVPDEYKGLPQLQGRAEVEMVLTKAEPGEKFDIKGKLYDNVKVRMVIDGYNAPITGGNFVDLITKGFYNKMVISRSDGFVVQFGDPEPQGDKHGYIPAGQTEDRKIPLEISLRGDDAPLYGITSEDDGRGYAATVLPFQAYGTLGMAREEYNPDSASSQVFWLLFESDLTPAGKNLLDGRYACFGYTIENAELLAGVKEGDIIQSAKVISGMDKFIKGST